MLRSLSSSSLKEVVTKYLMSQPAKEVTVYINSFFNCARQTPIVLLTALKLMIEKLALNDCRLKNLCETGTPPGHPCSSQESSSLTRTLLPPPMTFLLFWTPSDPIFVTSDSSLSNVFWNMWKTILFKTFDKVLLDVNSSTMCWEHKFREKRRKFFEEGGRMSELKALLVSERVFSLEDQRSAQACCYRNFSEYNEETLNNLLFMSDCHLYIAIPKWEVVKENHQSQFD